MEPFPEALKNEIKKLHPSLTESDFEEYLRLIFKAKIIDPLEFPEKRKDAEEQLAEFVRIHLPRLEEAHSVYTKKMEKIYEESIAPKLSGPVEIALADEEVSRWLQEKSAKTGEYVVDFKILKEPYEYIVEFKFKDGSVLHVMVNKLTRSISLIFKRDVS